MPKQNILAYCDKTGIFFSKHKHTTWRQVGSDNGHGYLLVHYNGKLHQAHRLAFFFMGIAIPNDKEVDHIDGDKQNNSFSNLRLVTRSENNHNTVAYSNSSTGIKGLSWSKSHNSWRGNITIDGKTKAKHSKDKQVVINWLAANRHAIDCRS